MNRKEMLHDLEAAYELGFGAEFMEGRPEKRKTFLAIRSLIESSGEKASGNTPHPLSKLAENMIDMTPEQQMAADDCLKDLIRDAPFPAPTIKKDVTVGPSIPERIKELMVYVAHWQTTRDMKKFPWTEEDKKAFGEVLRILQRSLPAPLPKEVEEAMETIRLRLNDLHIMEGDDREYIPGDDAAFSVLKAALKPKVVSREWIRKRADWAGCLGVTDVAGILRELGIEVSEGEMR